MLVSVPMTSPAPFSFLETLGNPNFAQLAAAIRARDFSLRHAEKAASFRQRAAIPMLRQHIGDADAGVAGEVRWALAEMD